MENCEGKVRSVTFVSESRQIMVKLREIVWRGKRGAVPQGGQGGRVGAPPPQQYIGGQVQNLSGR